MRNILFTPHAWEDYLYWHGQDKKTLKRINRLIGDAARNPFEGIGKPEPLRHELAGLWSRRIDSEHRLVYRADKDTLTILAARHHYTL